MKQYILFFLLVATIYSCAPKQQHALISTEYGDIKVVLYDETPLHRDNFMKLVNEGFYNDLLFHRVMQGFMIQGGDPNSKGAPTGARLGSGGPGYTIDKEFGHGYHFRGALAAARQPDQVNPEKKSSGSQFYIVQGRKWSEAELQMFQQQKNITYTEEDMKRYMEEGGYAPLDNEYTVFGEVVEGMDIIDKIAAVQVDPANRPLQDVKMTVSKSK